MRNKYQITPLLLLWVIISVLTLDLSRVLAQNYPSDDLPTGSQLRQQDKTAQAHPVNPDYPPGSGQGQGQGPRDQLRLEQTNPATPPATAETTPNTQQKKQTAQADQTDQKTRRTSKVRNIASLAQAQIDRAQNASDRLSEIIDRIKEQQTSLSQTLTSQDTKDLDALMVKAMELKTAVDKDLEDVKTKAGVLTGDLKDETLTSLSAATFGQQVKVFQATVKVLKKDLIALHQTLQQTVKELREYIKPASSPMEENTGTSTEENQ